MGEGTPPVAAWTAGALLYAGRPDPTWTLPETAEALVERFNRLARHAGSPPDQSQLGYRGVRLCAPDGRHWLAFNGVAWLERSLDVRRDEGRCFERAVLDSAPAGVLPNELPKP